MQLDTNDTTLLRQQGRTADRFQPSSAMSVELCDSDDDVVATAGAPAPQKPSAPAPAKASAAPAKAEKKRSREAAPPLPYGWIRKESKSKKGAYLGQLDRFILIYLLCSIYYCNTSLSSFAA
jgi:hypothetical protein